MLAGLSVNGQHVFTISEAYSSPSHIVTTKGSSVWLHWNYTYLGDGRHSGGITITTTYREQTIQVNSTSESEARILARKVGVSSALTLEAPIPPPFNGRVGLISSNSTLVIHDLRYNDSAYQFSSTVTMDLNLGAGFATNNYILMPVVAITVNGMSAVILL